MAINSIPAVFGVNQYIWDRINAAGILGNDYGGLIPIIPIEEEPTLLQAIAESPGIKTAPYIIYSYYNSGYMENWWEQEDTLVLVINALDQTKMRQLLLLITSNLKRWDESAQSVNRFIQASKLSDEYKAYEYKYISVSAGDGGAPTDIENEPLRAMLTIKICYTNSGNDVALP